jgi:D-glycero-D-manno-heptose 1,7-bisphosphate phosphatase
MSSDFFITDENVWSQVISGQEITWGRPALFLDRDGVIVEETNYLHRSEDVALIPGASEVIRHANELNIIIIIVTNQAGIGRRYYDWNQFVEVQKKMFSLLSNEGAVVDAVFACPHHSEARAPYFHKNHPCRKPNPGLLIMAESLMALDLNNSWIAGDRSTDLLAGLNAGCAGGIHLQTGHGIRDIERQTSIALANKNFPTQSLPSISDMLLELPLFKKQLH